jgi:UDP-3-O-[3-hydroxymyristoyl] glucosamine N-acyltransferase
MPPSVTLRDPAEDADPPIHPTAFIGDGTEVGAGARVGRFTVVGRDVRIGEDARIGSHVVIGDGCRIGARTVIAPQVTLYADVTLGDGCTLQSGARVGPDGFGFAWADGVHRKIPQVGGCRIGDDVALGANATVDRGSVGHTVLGSGCAAANLVHVGHNARLGRAVTMDAQAGIAGSATIGDDVQVGGQVAIMGHLTVGSGARVARWAGVTQSIAPRESVSGTPARPHRETRRSHALLSRLPRLLRRLQSIERRVAEGGTPAASSAPDPCEGEARS